MCGCYSCLVLFLFSSWICACLLVIMYNHMRIGVDADITARHCFVNLTWHVVSLRLWQLIAIKQNRLIISIFQIWLETLSFLIISQLFTEKSNHAVNNKYNHEIVLTTRSYFEWNFSKIETICGGKSVGFLLFYISTNRRVQFPGNHR